MTKLFRYVRILMQREPWWAEFWSAAGAIGWSLITLAAYQDVTQRELMAGLARVAGPIFWETAGFVLGAFQLVVLLQTSRWGRYVAAFLMSVWWGILALLVFGTDERAPHVAVYAVLAAANLFSLGHMAKPPYAVKSQADG